MLVKLDRHVAVAWARRFLAARFDRKSQVGIGLTISAVVFALAFSPIAWGLACAGAWVGRPAR
mgnify:CR=1 FL=1